MDRSRSAIIERREGVDQQFKERIQLLPRTVGCGKVLIKVCLFVVNAARYLTKQKLVWSSGYMFACKTKSSAV